MDYLIGVGSNRGQREQLIAQARDRLCQRANAVIHAEAPLLENPACGGPAAQADFLNGAWLLETALGPHQLLQQLQAVERQLGRTRSIAHGPRSIDLDLLLCRQVDRVNNAVLQLPHPRMHERVFVLQPASVIAPEWMHPILQRSLRVLHLELLNQELQGRAMQHG